MKIAETIYTHFQKVLFSICSDCVLQLSKYILSEENSWNHLHPLSKGPFFFICSDCVLQLSKYILSEEKSWNQINNWKKSSLLN
jgi:hypothetical protein